MSIQGQKLYVVRDLFPVKNLKKLGKVPVVIRFLFQVRRSGISRMASENLQESGAARSVGVRRSEDTAAFPARDSRSEHS